MAVSNPIPIEPGVLYRLEDFQRISGLGRHAMRSARTNGLRVRRVGNRAYVLSDDFFDFVDLLDREGRDDAE